MAIGDTIYVENPSDGRLYEVVTVPGFPHDDDGAECECVLIDGEQRIEVSDTILTARRADLVAQALGCPTQSVAWRLVPVRGSIRSAPAAA